MSEEEKYFNACSYLQYSSEKIHNLKSRCLVKFHINKFIIATKKNTLLSLDPTKIILHTIENWKLNPKKRDLYEKCKAYDLHSIPWIWNDLFFLEFVYNMLSDFFHICCGTRKVYMRVRSYAIYMYIRLLSKKKIRLLNTSKHSIIFFCKSLICFKYFVSR